MNAGSRRASCLLTLALIVASWACVGIVAWLVWRLWRAVT